MEERLSPARLIELCVDMEHHVGQREIFLSQESGWKALGFVIGISEIPLMILLGYFVGRQLGRPNEGVALGTLLGVILLASYGYWAYRKSSRIGYDGKDA